MHKLMIAAALAAMPGAALAQDDDLGEVVVTATRSQALSSGSYGGRSAAPYIGMRRLADFALQQVRIVGDTREAAPRREEIFAMLKGAVELAQSRGLELATGVSTLKPVTLANYRALPLAGDGRLDTDQVTFFLKTRLTAGNTGTAIENMDSFIKAVRPVGRAQIQKYGVATLSVVKPDQYRPAILDLVAADARATATRLGADYGVTVSGLDKPVEWTRATDTDVFLYVPYSYDVIPK